MKCGLGAIDMPLIDRSSAEWDEPERPSLDRSLAITVLLSCVTFWLAVLVLVVKYL
jgi:hypothetical protein